MQKTAIIYHYIALYRLPIFQELMKSKDVEYTIYSGKHSEIDIKKVSEHVSKQAIEGGGLRWKFFKNNWLIKKKFLWQSGLISEILKNQYDSYVFLGSPYHISTWLAVIIVRLQRKKAYFWMHGVYNDKVNLLDYVKLSVFYKLVNGYFLYGNRAATILKKYNKNNGRIINVIYNSLDYKKCLDLRILKVDENQIIDFRKIYFTDITLPTVCFIGRVNFIKRIDILLDAQKNIFEKTKKHFFNILIIGDGEEIQKLKEFSARFGLYKNIFFTGAIYDEKQIANLLSYSDICVTPGEVGLTAIHSMSYGTPVISHNNLNIQMPEVEAIKIGETGDLFEYGNIDSLINKLIDWFKVYPVKNQSVSDACMKIIDENYNPYYQLKIFDSVLNK
jgi:glycosyltransferase involved in cell wall biosynthesis